jgi:ubiquinol-cytochrome c reductase cytochrome b subunit
MKGRNHTPRSWQERLGVEKLVDALKGVQVTSDAISWRRFTGSLALVLIVLLFLSGAFMAFYYSPYPGAAYDSVQYAQYELPFGDVIRGVHHWSWNLLLVVVLVHLVQTFWTGAYKEPREMVWVSGVILLLFLPIFIVTGDLLPWTQEGYWTTQVRTSIMSSVPGAGPFMVGLLQGGPRTGVVALTRFYVLHTIFFPGLLMLLLFLHFTFLVCRGLSAPSSHPETPPRKVALFPVMVSRWLALFMFSVLVIGLVTRFWLPVPYADPADPTDSSFVPRPEWWVLFHNKIYLI